VSEDHNVLMKLGEVIGQLNGIDERLGRVDQKVDDVKKTVNGIHTNCAVQTEKLGANNRDHEKRLKKIEKKDAIGGTTLMEKGGIVLGVVLAFLQIGKVVWEWVRSINVW